MQTNGKGWAVAALALFVAWALWSYGTDGLVGLLLSSPPPGRTRLDLLREHVQAWGPLAPLVYVTAVTVEVVVAPFPGVLLYAPGGALFGGFLGGVLALSGNVIGAALAAWLARVFGAAWLARRAPDSRLAGYRVRLAASGAWLVFLLRLNPLTSSDLVSYAAGLAGVSPGRVAVGTLFGMAPLCFLQSYFAATLFEVLPPWLLAACGGAGLLAVGALVLRRRRK